MSEQNQKDNLNPNPGEPKPEEGKTNAKVTAPHKPPRYLSITKPGEYAKLMEKYYQEYHSYLVTNQIADKVSIKGVVKVAGGLATIVAAGAAIAKCFSKNNEEPKLIEAVETEDSVVE